MSSGPRDLDSCVQIARALRRNGLYDAYVMKVGGHEGHYDAYVMKVGGREGGRGHEGHYDAYVMKVWWWGQ